MMKKIIMIALVACAFALLGCSGDGNAATRITNADIEVPEMNDQPAETFNEMEKEVNNTSYGYDDDED